MSTSKLPAQPAAERRKAETELRGLVTKFAPTHKGLVGAARRWLRKRLPTACEVIYEYSGFFVISFSPNEHGYEGVFAIRADEDGVRLYLNRGKGLPDPEKLLKGSASLVRWIALEGVSTLTLPAVVDLVETAIDRNTVPFARTGSGAVVVRSRRTKPARKKSK